MNTWTTDRPTTPNTSATEAPREWRGTAVWAALLLLLLLSLFYYWFGIADRYFIFLYGHVAEGMPAAQPFDRVTSSRYWMAGLVAAGATFLLSALLIGIQGLIRRRGATPYRPPSWSRTWLLAAPPLTAGIPAIVMTVNRPTLPLSLAAACVLSTLVGLAIALPVARHAAALRHFAALMLDGLGLVPLLILMPALELPGEGISSWGVILPVLAVSAIVSLLWPGLFTLLYRRRGRTPYGAGTHLASALCWSYLLLPLAHYLFATPPEYRYISAASNFFADQPLLQLAIFLCGALLARIASIPRPPTTPPASL